MSGKGFIEEEPSQACELCGKFEETRPYGPNQEEVCFECGMKNQDAALRGVRRHIFGEADA